jgi:hypothetical protein
MATATNIQRVQPQVIAANQADGATTPKNATSRFLTAPEYGYTAILRAGPADNPCSCPGLTYDHWVFGLLAALICGFLAYGERVCALIPEIVKAAWCHSGWRSEGYG